MLTIISTRTDTHTQAVELKAMCKKCGCKYSGTKAAMVARLEEWAQQQSYENAPPAAAPTPRKKATPAASPVASRRSARIASRKKERAVSRSPSPGPRKQSEAASFPGKYPTVAVSDAWNAFTHYYVAKACLEGGQPAVAAGFATVALAATVGTVRFGLSERLEPYNTLLAAFAGLSAFVFHR